MQHLPRRHRSVLFALRIDLSLSSVDSVLRQALDHCAQRTGRPVLGGVGTPRRSLRQPGGAEA